MEKQLPIVIDGIVYDTFYKKMLRSVFNQLGFKITNFSYSDGPIKTKIVHEFVLQLINNEQRTLPNNKEIKSIRKLIKVHFYPHIAKLKNVKETQSFVIKVYNPLKKDEMWSWENY